MTHITDTSGVTRTYAPGGVSGAASSSGSHDATKRLVRIEQPDGTRYDVTTSRDLSSDQRQALETGRSRTVRYTDLAGNEVVLNLPDVDLAPFEERTGEEITIQHLTRRLLKDGTELLYDLGRLKEIRLTDGKVIKDFTVDRNGLPLRATLQLKDGTTQAVQNGALVEVTREDGVRLRYRNDVIAEVHVPVDALNDVTVSAVALDAQGRLHNGEVLLPSGDRLMIQGGRIAEAVLADGTQVRSVAITQDAVTGATLSVNGSNATLSNTRDVEVTLASGQQYLYRYKAVPDTALETMTFRDDFEDGNSLGWRTSGSWSIAGGALRGVELDTGNWTQIYAQTGLNWTDYTASTTYTLEQQSSGGGSTMLIFRYQDDNNYYALQPSRRTSDPRVGWYAGFVGKVSGQRFESAWFQLPGFNDSTPQSHTLRVGVSGSTFQFYVDGQQIGSATDPRLSRGSVGFGLDNNVTRFHDINVTFPGEDQRDPATRQVDTQLRSLRDVVSQATGPLAQIGVVPATYDSSAVDPSSVQVLESSSDPVLQTAVSAIQQATSDTRLSLVSEFDQTGQLLTSVSVDGSTTVYDAEGHPVFGYDRDGHLQVKYEYGGGGYLSKVTHVEAREQLASRIALARADVEQRATAALTALAQQKGVVLQDLNANFQVAREQAANQRATFQNQLQALESTDVHGSAARQQKSQALDQLRGGINQVLGSQADIERQYARQLAGLDAEVRSLQSRIESETAVAFGQIHAQETQMIKDLLRQEIQPILKQQYRAHIGRDPDDAEIGRMVDRLFEQHGADPTAQLDLEVVKAEIQSLPDYQARVDEVTAIKREVRAWLTTYMRAPPDATDPSVIASGEATKQSLLTSLNLTPAGVVPLTQSDVDKILTWLDSRSLHFGHSAFLALKEYLAAQGITTDSISLAVQAILTDILVGVITPKTTGDLELSLYAIRQLAKLHGAQATAAQVTFDDLKDLLATSDQQPATGSIIAHVNGNHYILVKSIAADGTVTYREPNAGSSGQTLTMSQGEFERIWEGVILTPRAPPQAWQVLSDSETQEITGSFFPLIFIFLAKLVAGIVSAISGVLSFITGTLATLVNSLGAALTALGNALGPLGFIFNGLGSIVSGLGHALAGLTYIFGGQFALGLETIWQGIGLATGLSGGLGQFALQTAVNIGVSQGLQAVGVDPAIASIAGAFASGGIGGALNPAKGVSMLTSAWQGAVTSTAIAGTQIGLVKAGLDPTLASLAGIGVGAITNSLLAGVNVPQFNSNGTPKIDPATSKQVTVLTKGLGGLGYTLSTNLVPTLAGELTYYGIQRLGESVGLDPRISQLAGITLRAGIGNIANPGNATQNVLKGMQDGLTRGALQVGLSFATQDLDPLLGGLASSAVTGAIDGLITAQDPLDPNSKRKGIFAGIGETFTRAVGGFTAIGKVVPGDPVTTAQNLAQLNDFSTIIREQGLGAAVETYATSLLYRSSVESLISAGNNFSIQQAINSQLQDPNNLVELDGQSVIQISLGADASGNRKYLWVDPTAHSLVASLQGQDYIRYVAPPKVHEETGTAALTDAEITRTIPNPLTGEQVTAKIRLEAAGADWIEIQGPNGTAYRITPDNLNRLRLDNDGTVKDGILTDLVSGAKYYFQDGYQVAVRQPAAQIRTKENPFKLEDLEPETVIVPDVGITAGDLEGISIEVTQDPTTGDTQVQLVPTDPSDASAIQRLQTVFSRLGGQIQAGTEKLVNGLLWFGPYTNQELAAHKTAEIERIVNDPGQIYVIHTKTNAPISYVTRAATLREGDFDNVNHSALAFQGTDGQVYVIDIVDFREPGSNTNVRVKRLEEWAKPYTDIQAQALPLTETDIVEFGNKSLFGGYVDKTTMQPMIELNYDRAGAILGAGATVLPITPQPNAQTICSNMVCDIIRLGTGAEIPGLPESRYVTPNDLRHAIDAWIKQSQGQQ